MSKSNITPEDRFYNERLLKTALPEMEAERAEHREAISKISATDPEGSKLLSQCYDVYMGALIGSIRKQRGGLLPYAMAYESTGEALPSPNDPHLFSFAYRDSATDTNLPITHIAVVYLDASYPPVGREITSERIEAAATAIDDASESYFDHVKALDAVALVSPVMFHLPLMAVYSYLIGSVTLSDDMIDAPEARESPNTFFPFEVLFNDEGDAKQLRIRMVQVVETGPALAVELALRLDNLDRAIALEKRIHADLPPTQSLH